jgi:hypothetical protein
LFSITLHCFFSVDDNLTQPFSKSQLVFLVYTRAMPNSLQVYSVFRIKILQQCWIIAARCAIKGNDNVFLSKQKTFLTRILRVQYPK